MRLGNYKARAQAFWRSVPWPLVLVMAAIAGIGVWNLISASRTIHAPIWKAQSYWLMIGLGVVIVIAAIDYRKFIPLAYPAYAVVIALLVAVLLFGKTAKGGQRWLDFGPMHLQPSELAKLAVALAVARYFHASAFPKGGHTLRMIWFPALLVVVPVLLTAKQPDLGTAIMIAAVGGSVLLFAKVRFRSVTALVLALAAISVLAWNYTLKDYQKQRILTFLNPEQDTLGAGYHASQSLIALGSGMAKGKGWGQGTQTQLSFLPEQHTDFIFSVWGEEQGFVGAIAMLGLYWLATLLALGVVAGAKDRFGSLLALGCAAMIFWQTVVNVSMVTGMLPVVGVTLPLMSYGGSSVLTTLAALGILVNISARRGQTRQTAL